MRKFSWTKVNVEVPVPIPGAVRLRQSQAFKLAAALAVGIVAALIIMMTGFGAEYKTSTVMYRALVGFLFGSVSVFILEQFIDRIGIPMFVAKNADMQSVWVSEAYDDDYLYALEEETAEAADEEEAAEETGEETAEQSADAETDAAVDELLADVASEDSPEKTGPDFVPFFAEEGPAEFSAFTAENLPKAE